MSVLHVILLAIGFSVLVSALVSIPVWLLWNGCLVGAISGVNEITWLQAFGINILANIIFKTGVETKK